mmetsp:Transcript_20160/g.52443  ORF Transcript_20160/g.52443 Transcript_20160/m.52443 type:complete len:345 (-) Transcript_20160:1771-2805(-)
MFLARSPCLSQRHCGSASQPEGPACGRRGAVACASARSPRQPTTQAEYIYKAMAVRNLAAFSFTSHILHTALRANSISPEGDFLFQKTPPTHKSKANSTSTQPRTATSTGEAHSAASTATAAAPSSSSSEARVKTHLLHDLVQQECRAREELVVQEAMVVGSLQSAGGPNVEAGETSNPESPAAAAAAALRTARAAQEGALADCGAEMDPLSAELDLEIKCLRQDLLRAVEDHAQVAARLEGSAVGTANEDSHHLTSPAAATAAPGAHWVQESKQLQVKWQQLAYENMYLQVRIAQLRQLPGLPKRKITMAAVREQQVQELFFRRSLLTQRTSEMAHSLLSRTA